ASTRPLAPGEGGADSAAAAPVASYDVVAAAATTAQVAPDDGVAANAGATPVAPDDGVAANAAATPVAPDDGVAANAATAPVAPDDGVAANAATAPVAPDDGVAAELATPRRSRGAGQNGRLPALEQFAADLRRVWRREHIACGDQRQGERDVQTAGALLNETEIVEKLRRVLQRKLDLRRCQPRPRL